MLNGQGHDAAALAGAHSQYDVFADGELVFSKQQQGRFPDEHEIVGLLKEVGSS